MSRCNWCSLIFGIKGNGLSPLFIEDFKLMKLLAFKAFNTDFLVSLARSGWSVRWRIVALFIGIAPLREGLVVELQR